MVLVHAGLRVRAALVAALVLDLLVTAASPVHAERLPTRRYTTADGLPHDHVTCVVQDSHGFVWFCTAGGLSRFDGHSFITYTERDGLPSNAVTHFLEAGVGDYWVATARGICRFTAVTSRCHVHRLGEDLISNSTSVLYRDRSRHLWAGTGRELFRLDAKVPSAQFERASFIPDDALIRVVRAMAGDAIGGFWMATATGLWQHLAGGRVRRYTFDADPNSDRAGTLAFDGDGRLWIGHRSGLIVLKPSSSMDPIVLHDVSAAGAIELPTIPGEAIRFVDILGASGREVSALYQSPLRSMWIGTRDSGLVRFQDGHSHRLPAARGLPIVDAIALTGDREGNVWAGTVADGALKIARPSFVTYDESEGLPSDRIVSVFDDRGGAPIVVTADGVTHRFDGTRFTSVRPNLPVNFVANVAQSGQVALQAQTGDWWFRTPDALFRFAVRGFDDLAHTVPQARYTTRDGLRYGQVSRMRLFEDSRHLDRHRTVQHHGGHPDALGPCHADVPELSPAAGRTRGASGFRGRPRRECVGGSRPGWLGALPAGRVRSHRPRRNAAGTGPWLLHRGEWAALVRGGAFGAGTDRRARGRAPRHRRLQHGPGSGWERRLRHRRSPGPSVRRHGERRRPPRSGHRTHEALHDGRRARAKRAADRIPRSARDTVVRHRGRAVEPGPRA